MLHFLSLHFVQHALAACFLASIVCSTVGTLVVLNRLVFLAGGVAHAAYGGVGIAFFFRLPVLPSLIGFTSFSALLMGALTSSNRERTDVLIGTLWATGMTVGIVLLNLSGGYNADLMSYLFGSVLAVSTNDLIVMSVIAFLIVALTVWRYNEFLLFSFDREYARTRGVNVTVIYLLLLLMTALATVIMIRVVGIILTVALLTIPPYIGMRLADKLWKMMIVACGCALVFCIGGLFIAYWLNLTASAAIVLLGAATLGLMLSVESFRLPALGRKPDGG